MCACHTHMDLPTCFVCGMISTGKEVWADHSIVNLETGKHVHYSCMLKRIDELNEELEYHPCCDKMMKVAGWKISIDIFTETFAVYDPNNEMKYYFNGIRFCPFCGKGIMIKKSDKYIDISV